ncbi:MAG: hypothetical protein KDE51_03560 [Anaerolineales bacterium]|nr:hypothetical protein [Anaerolineales bacterium]
MTETTTADTAAVETMVASAPAANTQIVQTAPSAQQRCASPAPENVALCEAEAAAILATTVRLELRRAPNAKRSTGHATIVAGRYLLTHNHFNLSLQEITDEFLGTLTVTNAQGKTLVDAAPFKAFDVLVATPETLIFDFGPYGGVGLFGMLGLSSAQFDPQQAAQIRPGMEVAQVNWDGSTAHVDWVEVQAVSEEHGVPVLILANFVEQGASGGGVFYNGYHLGNNWFRSTVEAADGSVLQQYSVAAVNPAQGFANFDLVKATTATEITSNIGG